MNLAGFFGNFRASKSGERRIFCSTGRILKLQMYLRKSGDSCRRHNTTILRRFFSHTIWKIHWNKKALGTTKSTYYALPRWRCGNEGPFFNSSCFDIFSMTNNALKSAFGTMSVDQKKIIIRDDMSLKRPFWSLKVSTRLYFSCWHGLISWWICSNIHPTSKIRYNLRYSYF